MIHVELLRDKGILIVVPQGALAADDFRAVAAVADPYIAEKGGLTGLMIRASSFPVARAVATHLAQPDIRQFGADEEARALAWLETGR